MIYDDQCDYFKVDKSGAVSEGDSKDSDKAKKDFYSTGRFPRHEMRMSLNLATRTVTVEEREDIKNEEKFISDVHKLLEIHSKRFPKYFYTNDKLKDVRIMQSISLCMICSCLLVVGGSRDYERIRRAGNTDSERATKDERGCRRKSRQKCRILCGRYIQTCKSTTTRNSRCRNVFKYAPALRKFTCCRN